MIGSDRPKADSDCIVYAASKQSLRRFKVAQRIAYKGFQFRRLLPPAGVVKVSALFPLGEVGAVFFVWLKERFIGNRLVAADHLPYCDKRLWSWAIYWPRLGIVSD
jgi:hypothetical protein